MKKIIVICLSFVFLVGCRKLDKSEMINDIEVQCQIEFDLNYDNYAYLYRCDLMQASECNNFDDHITIYEGDFFCDGVVISDIQTQGMNSKFIPCNLCRLKANYNKKDADELLEYVNEYIENNVLILQPSSHDEYVINSGKLMYIIKQCGNENYLVPVVEFGIKDYGKIYIEVNSGCIVW